MRKYRNPSLFYNGKEYEIFWTSQDAKRVCHMLSIRDTRHDLDHEAIVNLLVDYEQAGDMTDGRHLFLSNNEKGLYVVHVHLEDAAAGQIGRCTIKSCFKSDNEEFASHFFVNQDEISR